MNCPSLFVVVALLILLTSSAGAQSPLATPKTQPDNGVRVDNSAAKAEADRIRKERQSQARSLLISLAQLRPSIRLRFTKGKASHVAATMSLSSD